MILSIGIVGLPNAGKSTLFNALVKAHQAKVENYPFTTIEPNVGMVEVPDGRLEQIAKSLSIEKKIPATIKFIDIAGLVKDAHKGEGLGNKFLAHIREVDAILQIFRAFDNKDVPGVAKPADDVETINIELELGEIKKPTLYVANISEKDIGKNIEYGIKGQVIPVCAKTEEELSDLSAAEQDEYLKTLGLSEPALNRVIKESYKLLELITMYTLKDDQVQAWPIIKGSKVPQAAGKVHGDMERGFIAADVINYEELIAYGSWHIAKEKGKIRTEGKEYIIQDSDVVHFKFNV